MKRVLYLLALLFGSQGFAQVCDSLVSPCVSTFSRNGYFFDLEALNPIQIQGFSYTVQNAGTRDIAVYYKVGTHVGSENNASAWNLIGNITGNTPINAMACPLPHNQFLFASAINMNGGDRYGFYFQMTSGTGTLESHSTIPTGNIGAQDVNLILYSGVGANPIAAPFTQTLTSNLTFQGAVIYDCVTSTADQQEPRIRIYPNPAQNALFVELNSGSELQVMDITGKVALGSDQYLSGINEISISSLEPGIYLIQGQTSGGKMIREYFVKL